MTITALRADGKPPNSPLPNKKNKKILALDSKGMPQWQIALILDIDPSTVSKKLKKSRMGETEIQLKKCQRHITAFRVPMTEEKRMELEFALKSTKPLTAVERDATCSKQPFRNRDGNWVLPEFPIIMHHETYDVCYLSEDGLVELRRIDTKKLMHSVDGSIVLALYYNNEQYPVATLVIDEEEKKVIEIPYRTPSEIRRIELLLRCYPNIPGSKFFTLIIPL